MVTAQDGYAITLNGTTLDDAADYVALLDKCGKDSPMQKRIISILFMLSDASLRFSQLQQRQAKVMPPTLVTVQNPP